MNKMQKVKKSQSLSCRIKNLPSSLEEFQIWRLLEWIGGTAKKDVLRTEEICWVSHSKVSRRVVYSKFNVLVSQKTWKSLFSLHNLFSARTIAWTAQVTMRELTLILMRLPLNKVSLKIAQGTASRAHVLFQMTLPSKNLIAYGHQLRHRISINDNHLQESQADHSSNTLTRT